MCAKDDKEKEENWKIVTWLLQMFYYGLRSSDIDDLMQLTYGMIITSNKKFAEESINEPNTRPGNIDDLVKFS